MREPQPRPAAALQVRPVSRQMTSMVTASLCAAAHLRHVLEERERDDLQSFGHSRVDMDHVDEVMGGRPEAHAHGGLMYDLARVAADHGNTKDPVALALQHHLDDPAPTANRHRTRPKTNRACAPL